MNKIGIYSLIAALCISFESKGQNKIHFQELKVGDSIPTALWNLPLQVVNHSEKKNEITLNEYRGKLLILDFWATWCGSCIAAFPKITALNKSFKDSVLILPVTNDAGKMVMEFSSKNKIMQENRLLSVVNDKKLNMIFPHRMKPHEVWILPNGKVGSITDGTQLTAKNIRHFLISDTVEVNQKRDVMDFDKDKPLLIDGNGAKDTYFLKRSLITKYISGVPSFMGYPNNSEAKNGKLRYYATNVTILNLYSLAFPQISNFPRNRIILNVKSANRYFQSKVTGENWIDSNLYCYELIAPATSSGVDQFIVSDLDTFFELKGRIEDRMVKCYIIKPISDNELERNSMSSANTQKLSSWIYKFNSKTNNTPLINEWGLGNLDVPKDLSSPNEPSTIEFLRSRGLKIIEEIRPIEMFILTEL